LAFSHNERIDQVQPCLLGGMEFELRGQQVGLGFQKPVVFVVILRVGSG